MKEETPLPTLRNEKDYKGIVNNCMSMHSIKQMKETNYQKDTNHEPDSSRCRKFEYATSNQTGNQIYFHKEKSGHRWLHWIILSNIKKKLKPILYKLFLKST